MSDFSLFKFRPGIAGEAAQAALDVLEQAGEPREACLAVAGLLMQLHVMNSPDSMDDTVTITLAVLDVIMRGPPDSTGRPS